MKHVIVPLAGMFLMAASALGGGPSSAPLRVLIVDGFGNHDWQRTTRLIQGILAGHPGFRTAVATAPARADDPGHAAWKPDFSAFDVVIQTCNDINGSGAPWPEQARRDFESFVAKGGGVFVFHSGNNAFPKWDAYNSLIGLGWRDQNSGTAIRIRPDETLERIPPGEGASTGHGARTDRAIHRLGEHPIHAGLPRVWRTPLIEVYTHARGPAENLEVLSWAEDPATGGRWPIEWAVSFGKGRVYTSTFGHVWKDEADPVDMRCAGFQTVLVRALHWLAKQDVLPAVPADFPTASSISLRPLREREAFPTR
jgi:type 1 glutamine amidotransferase